MLQIFGVSIYTLLAYSDFLVEAALLACLLAIILRGRGKGLLATTAYMLVSVGVGALRAYAEWMYGLNSPHYASWYWATDFVIVSAVFLLICYFFRRASLGGASRLWPHLRLMLSVVFLLTAAVSFFIVSYHHVRFFPYFVLEFQQDLYFVCLILTTILYLFVVHYDYGDEQLGLLVAGLGIEYAGFAASLALFHVTGGGALYGAIAGYLFPLCDMGMALLWLYTAARVPYRVTARAAGRAPQALPVRGLAHIG